MGFEKATGAEGKLQDDFMKKNWEESNGYLKELPVEDINYLPITCSHTMATCNLVDGGCKGLYPEFCDENGIMCKDKILAICPSWSKPLDEGIECIVFRRELEERLPDLPSLLSDFGNQSHDSHQKLTKLQLMLSIHTLFMSKQHSANPDSWSTVVIKVEGMMPQFKELVEEAANYVKNWSGTAAKPDLYLQELETFAKSLQARREPEIGQIAFLAKADLKRFPLWINACFKCLLVAAEVFLQKGESEIFTSTDMLDMGKNFCRQSRKHTA